MGIGLKRLARLVLTAGTSRMACGAHVTRYFMYEHLKHSINDPGKGAGKRILSISHSETLIGVLGLERATIVEANYPEYSATDLSPFATEAFDFVISDQVLEHVEGDPQKVFDESYRLLRPGGIAVHTTCFINPFHGFPSDYWRFTPNCLEMLARRFSKVIDVGGAGNRMHWVLEWLGLRYAPVPHAKWHPLNKVATTLDPLWPVSTWILAQK
jgi:SAM-dependent methyltransferase